MKLGTISIASIVVIALAVAALTPGLIPSAAASPIVASYTTDGATTGTGSAPTRLMLLRRW
jgi:hypothetical protein